MLSSTVNPEIEEAGMRGAAAKGDKAFLL